MLNNILIFLILMSSVFFFRFAFLPTRIIFLVQFGILALMFLFIVIQKVYGKGETIKHNFSKPIFLIFTAVFLSMIIAQAYHNQNYVLTFWAQRVMYFYLLYFLLHILKPNIKDLEKMILILGMIYAGFYIVQYAIYPTIIFDVNIMEERQTLRIGLPGGGFMVISIFIFLNWFYMQNKLRYIFVVLLFLSIVILGATRNSIAAIFIVVVISLLYSKIIRSRYIIYFLVLLSLIPVYILFQDIIISMTELTSRQSANIQSDIRVRAATFFLTDFFPNKLAYLFGNGQDHMGSIYGMRVNAYKIYQGFHQDDVGFIGEFSKYGIIFALGAFWLYFKALATRIKPQYSYIKFHLIRSSLLLPFGGPFTNSESIAILCILFYIIDTNIRELKAENQAREVLQGSAVQKSDI